MRPRWCACSSGPPPGRCATRRCSATPGAAALATLATVIVALAANVSPANAALRSGNASNTAAHWPSVVSLVAAVALLAVTWTGSALAAARRERSMA